MDMNWKPSSDFFTIQVNITDARNDLGSFTIDVDSKLTQHGQSFQLHGIVERQGSSIGQFQGCHRYQVLVCAFVSSVGSIVYLPVHRWPA